MKKSLLIAVTICTFLLGFAAAAEDTTSTTERERGLASELRCVVCQNQSLLDSDADLARDMRGLIRKRIKLGDSNEEIRAFLVERYGDFILLKPPLKPSTWILWGGPAFFLALAILLAVTRIRRRRADVSTHSGSPS